MNFDSNTLQKLCNIHSVVGDTENVIGQLKRMLSDRKIKSTESDFGLLLFGNLKNPKLMISAHVDEVGFQVINKKDNGTFLIKKSGHVDAAMMNNSNVYVHTKLGDIPGCIYPELDLGNNKPNSFTEIFLDTIDNSKIAIGDFGSYTRVFSANREKVIATGLDNKISVLMILDLIAQNPALLNSTLFAFVTEEETTYDCIAGLTHQYHPQYAIVLDMLMVNQRDASLNERIPEINKGPAVLYSMHSYHLHPKLRKILESLDPVQQGHFDIDFPPEAQIVQRNGITKGINVLVPMFGWHNCAYSMYVQDYNKTKEFTMKLSKKLLS